MIPTILPKGITKTAYQNKDGTEVIKYRVRINRAGFKLNKLFDNYELAEEAINLSLTKVGQNSISQFLKGEEVGKTMKEMNLGKTLQSCLEVYNKEHYQKFDDNIIHEKNNNTYDNMINSINNTRIENWREFDKLPPALKSQYGVISNQKFGDLDPFQIQPADITAYIKKRLSDGKAHSTVIRELSILSSFFNNFHNYTDNTYYLLAENNPVTKAKKVSKKKLSNVNDKRDRRLTKEEEQRLEEALMTAKKPQILLIVLLAMNTGLRRSSILTLTPTMVKGEYFHIPSSNTKNNKVAKIKILDEAKEIIKKIVKYYPNRKKDERYFTYTVDGFKSVMQRILKKAQIDDFHFHDIRAGFISQALESGLNEYVVSELSGINNQKYFNATHLTKYEDTKRFSKGKQTLKDIQSNSQHSDVNMQKHYARNLTKDITTIKS